MTFTIRLFTTVATLACLGSAHASEGTLPQDDLKQQLMTTYAPGLSGDIVPYVDKLLTGVSSDCDEAKEIIEAAAPLASWQLDLVLNHTSAPLKNAKVLKAVKGLTPDMGPLMETLLEGAPRPSKIFKAAQGLTLEQLQFIVQRDFSPEERDAALMIAHTLKSEHIPQLLKLFEGARKEEKKIILCAPSLCSTERLALLSQCDFAPYLRQSIIINQSWMTDEEITALKDFTNNESIPRTLKEIVVANAPCLDTHAYPHVAFFLPQVSAKKGVGFLMAIMGKPQETLTHAATLPLEERLPYLRAQPIPLDWCFSHMGKLESVDFQILSELNAYMSEGVQNNQDILARLFSQMSDPDPVTAKRTQKFVRKFYKILGLEEHYQKVDEILSLLDDLLERVAATRNPDLLGKIIFGQEDHMGKGLFSRLMVGLALGGESQSHPSSSS